MPHAGRCLLVLESPPSVAPRGALQSRPVRKVVPLVLVAVLVDQVDALLEATVPWADLEGSVQHPAVRQVPSREAQRNPGVRGSTRWGARCRGAGLPQLHVNLRPAEVLALGLDEVRVAVRVPLGSVEGLMVLVPALPRRPNAPRTAEGAPSLPPLRGLRRRLAGRRANGRKSQLRLRRAGAKEAASLLAVSAAAEARGRRAPGAVGAVESLLHRGPGRRAWKAPRAQQAGRATDASRNGFGLT
mmetsp:Transcript_8787/g.17503  ORF Transcript_8787/g.17503 Transcript_8787/m.17503 type:complete len:244 (-) Transcript_8787:18-749(-)